MATESALLLSANHSMTKGEVVLVLEAASPSTLKIAAISTTTIASARLAITESQLLRLINVRAEDYEH